MDLSQYAGTSITDVTLERHHQFELGYTLDHDNEHHSPEELLRVGACYLDVAASIMEPNEDRPVFVPPANWPKTSIPWVTEKSPEGYAVKAAAFTLAGLDLLHARRMEGLDNERAE